MSFQSLDLNKRVLQAIDDAGYDKITPIQSKAIPAILTGADMIGIAQTGTGKTAAFTLPLISQLCAKTDAGAARETRVLIIVPTRELAMQINQKIRTYGKYTNLRTVIVIGGASEKHQVEKLDSNVDIVIATPGRLLALLQDGHCSFGKLTHLILDEADRMLDMGFFPDIYEITTHLPKRRQSLLFSATFPQQVEKLSGELLNKPKVIEVGQRKDPAATVKQYIYPVEQHLKAELFIHLLGDHRYFSVIAFVRTRDGADDLHRMLKDADISSEVIHSERTQNHRFRALRDFKASKIRVLVATDIAARGLDIPDVTHVANIDFPQNSEDYIHRVGRTGRAGSEGCAITFLTSRDEEKLKKLERHIGKTLAQRREKGFDYNKLEPEEDESQRDKRRVPQKSKKYNMRDRMGNSKNTGAGRQFSKNRKPKKRRD